MMALFSLLVLVISASAHLSSEDHSSILIASIMLLMDTAVLPLTTVLSSHNNNSTEDIEYSQWLATYHHHYTIHLTWIVATSLLLSIITYIHKDRDITPSHYQHSIPAAYLVVFLFALMSATTWIASQHFSLAMLVAITTVPSAIALYSITLQTDEESGKAGLPPSVVLGHTDPIIIVAGPEHLICKPIKEEKEEEDHDADRSRRRRGSGGETSSIPPPPPPRTRYYSALLAVSMVHSTLSS
jgi:hypothetical protein